MNRPENHPSHELPSDPLDEVLRSAAWPEPEPDRLQRLEQRWSRLWVARVRRRRAASVLCLVTIAAGLCAAIRLWPLLPGGERESREIAPATPLSEPHEQHAPSEPHVPPSRQVVDRQVAPVEMPHGLVLQQAAEAPSPQLAPAQARKLVRSRPATPYERLAFRALTRRRLAGPKRPDHAVQSLVTAAIERRVAEPAADLDELAKPLLDARLESEQALIASLQRSSGPRQFASIELLGCVGTRQSVPALVALAAFSETHAPSVRALARLADAETIARLAAAERDPALQHELFAALLDAGDLRSVVAYLEFVQKPETRAQALAALDRAAAPPLDALFLLLDSSQQAQRTAAAVVLGRIDRREVSETLIQMVLRDVQRPEALLALAASSRTEASQFVALARRDPTLAGPAGAAQYKLERLFPPTAEVN
jgi:hypothetical protein